MENDLSLEVNADEEDEVDKEEAELMVELEKAGHVKEEAEEVGEGGEGDGECEGLAEMGMTSLSWTIVESG